jgi:hypothetical protein
VELVEKAKGKRWEEFRCVFHTKLTTRFTNNLPLISEQIDQ